MKRQSTGYNTKFLPALLVLFASVTVAEEIGSVDTKLRPLSPDDSIRIEAVADPNVSGVVCYLSRAEIGGYSGALGLAEDTSDASIDCRQVGPIRITKSFKKGDRVHRERRSFIFKSLRVIRFCDTSNNALVYLVYSEKLVDGSPKNSVSAVPIVPWPGQDQPTEQCRYK